jgi:hypothetical protein
MSKQTALQWYIEQCENIKYNPLEKNGYTIAKEKITKQALEMEQEQIEKAYIKGREDWQKYGYSHYNYEKDMEIPTPRKYYNETYGE